MRKYYTVILLLVSCVCYGQTVKIFVDSNNLKMHNQTHKLQTVPDLPIASTYDYSKMNWIINSKKITWSLDTFEIKLNNTGFDTIKYFVLDKPDTLTLICKFRHDNIYEIGCNECCGGFNLWSITSSYLRPADIITFKFKNRPENDSLFAGASNRIVGMAFLVKLKNKFSFNYIRSLSNSIANIAIFTGKIDTTKGCTPFYCLYPTISDKNKPECFPECLKDIVDLYNFKYVFLHSEHLEITYDFKTNKSNVKIK